MLALYPSNKLEHLSFLLSALLSQQSQSEDTASLFTPQTILVESPGMQHWLNMSLAQDRSVAMNLSFPLPVRFMWDTARKILGEERVPKQSPFRREVLVWRIDAIIRSAAFSELPEAEAVNRYWQQCSNEEEASVQRLQFATALADVYEQYLLFRPQWLFAWEEGKGADTGNSDEVWQAVIWRALVKENRDHPARLHADAMQALAERGSELSLPENIIVFAINTMAPQLVQFLDALAVHTHIHVFHLNPSVNYWGEVKSNKEQAKLLRESGLAQWQEARQDNPLLGNLGQQGRDLFNLLTPLESYEVSAFDTDPVVTEELAGRRLHAMQEDILHACAPEARSGFNSEDNSITVVSAHTALREVQALHDYLLTLMNTVGADGETPLKPSDIVVMCPAIEEYAPFVEAVFHRVGTPEAGDTEPPRIPCSIADRAPLDAEPMIAAFVRLLSLPDSRFEVSQIIDYLRLEPVQRKFRLTSEDIDMMSEWLHQAHVHWGRNAAHKSALLDKEAAETFTWAWGLRRLLTGMTMKDSPLIAGDILTIPDVEGQSTVLLGKLIHLLEALSLFASELKTPRNAEEWHDYLNEMKAECFEATPEDMPGWEAISKATADLVTHCEQAGFSDELTLSQIRAVLVKKFTTPDAANHFLTGQVTFCSMLPMRSIPFKVVCILGLNDGEFPRQSAPLSIDLMAKTPRKTGDRSRRLEDRYLFLEALISAREYLYLSYQGRRGKDNTERQPSLVLSELLAVLNSGYEFTPSCVRQLPLHPFSPANFTGDMPSFESGWFRLAGAVTTVPDGRQGEFAATSAPLPHAVISTDDMAGVFDNPLRAFAGQRLGVRLEQAEPLLADEEPFSENNLLRFNALRAFTEAGIHQQDKTLVRETLQKSGDFPDTPLTPALMESWEQAGAQLSSSLGLHVAEQNYVSADLGELQLEAGAWLGSDGLKMLHYGSQNAKRMMAQYLTLLCFNANGNDLPLQVFYLKWTKGQAELRQATWQPVMMEEAQQRLEEIGALYRQVLSEPVPCFAGLAVELTKKYTGGRKKEKPQIPLSQWLSSTEGLKTWENALDSGFMQASINDDPYVRWFFPQGLLPDQFPCEAAERFFVPLLLNQKDGKVS